MLDNARLSQELKARREALRLTVAEVARKVGMTRSGLTMLEHGHRNWNEEILAKYEAALDESKKELLATVQ